MEAMNPGSVSAAMGTNPTAAGKAAKLFLALWPDAAARRALCIAREAWHWPAGARLVPAEKLHLTVHFLGHVPAQHVPALISGLVIRFSPFEMSFNCVCKWKRGLVVAVPDPVPLEYRELHARLGLALRTCGFSPDSRPPRPHITLARRAGTAKPLRRGEEVAAQALRAARWLVADFTLVQSAPAGGYPIVHRFPST